MTAPHYLVFIGATASLSTELLRIQKRVVGLTIVAPAASKGSRGLSSRSVEQCLASLVKVMRRDGGFEEPARLSVWSYSPNNADAFELLWSFFGQSGWVEFIPEGLADKDQLTRQYIENKIGSILTNLHAVSSEIYSNRRRSAFILPSRNFRSKIMEETKGHWYSELKIEEIRLKIRSLNQRFRQFHIKNGGHVDERNISFKPAEDGECHGKPHPTGENDNCFVSGRFRFGAAIYPGFHFDVRDAKKKVLSSIFVECGGLERRLKSENRTYINIFPNDHILPQK